MGNSKKTGGGRGGKQEQEGKMTKFEESAGDDGESENAGASLINPRTLKIKPM